MVYAEIPFVVRFHDNVTDSECEQFWLRFDPIAEKHGATYLGWSHIKLGIESTYRLGHGNRIAFCDDVAKWLDQEVANNSIVFGRVYTSISALIKDERELKSATHHRRRNHIAIRPEPDKEHLSLYDMADVATEQPAVTDPSVNDNTQGETFGLFDL